MASQWVTLLSAFLLILKDCKVWSQAIGAPGGQFSVPAVIKPMGETYDPFCAPPNTPKYPPSFPNFNSGGNFGGSYPNFPPPPLLPIIIDDGAKGGDDWLNLMVLLFAMKNNNGGGCGGWNNCGGYGGNCGCNKCGGRGGGCSNNGGCGGSGGCNEVYPAPVPVPPVYDIVLPSGGSATTIIEPYPIVPCSCT